MTTSLEFIEITRTKVRDAIKEYRKGVTKKPPWKEEKFDSMFLDNKYFQVLVNLGIKYHRLAVRKEEGDLTLFEIGKKLQEYGANKNLPGFVNYPP